MSSTKDIETNILQHWSVKTTQVLKQIYSENCDQWGKISKVEWVDVALKFAEMYKENNPEFDKEKFLYACVGKLARNATFDRLHIS